MINHTYLLRPVPKFRMSQGDKIALARYYKTGRASKWLKPSALRYTEFCNAVRAENLSACISLEGISEVSFVFHMPLLKSWSKAERSRSMGAPHQKRPDLDNLIKAMLDAYYPKGGTVGEDSHIWKIKAAKIYTLDKPKITVELR